MATLGKELDVLKTYMGKNILGMEHHPRLPYS